MTRGTPHSDGIWMKIESVRFTSHALERMRERKISEELILSALKSPDEIFWDLKKNRYVAVKRTEGQGGIAIPFEVKGTELIVVTVIRIKKLGRTVENCKGRRWVEAKVQLRFEV